ncbi:hypothetical protein Tco_0856840 [Tanacetum coccineum]|uniref:Uncharacterized protein n=1 Tax=Tanacetum coccineum TaxID=301880 RepID=A0ABQ5B8C8_9ASTR
MLQHPIREQLPSVPLFRKSKVTIRICYEIQIRNGIMVDTKRCQSGYTMDTKALGKKIWMLNQKANPHVRAIESFCVMLWRQFLGYCSFLEYESVVAPILGYGDLIQVTEARILDKTLHAIQRSEGIEHQTSTPEHLKQNGNRSSSYLLMDRQHITSSMTGENLQLKHSFTSLVALCYLTRAGRKLGKMKEKGDPWCPVWIFYSKNDVLFTKQFGAAPQRQEMSVENVASWPRSQDKRRPDYDNSGPPWFAPKTNVVPYSRKDRFVQSKG